MDFEEGYNGVEGGSWYLQEQIQKNSSTGADTLSYPGWLANTEGTEGGIVVISSGNAKWGHTSASNGSFFVGLQRADAWIEQRILLPSDASLFGFTISFVRARRRGK